MAIVPNIVFFGNERLVSGLPRTETPTLKGLLQSQYNVVAIVSHHTDSNSRNNRPLEVAELAEQYNIPLLTPDKPIDIKGVLVDLNADVAVLSSYGKIVPQEIIDIFPKGIINIHPSLLPKYRGPTPIESVILNGDTQTGISIMNLAAAMDAGDIYAQEALELSGHETKFDVYNQLSALGAKLLLDNLPQILDGTLKPLPQDDSQATYCQLLRKEDGILNPTTTTALAAERQVRAFLGFPKTRYTLFNQQIVITKAHVSDQKLSVLDIECSDSKFLSIDELIGPSGKSMSGQAFLNGYQN